MFTRTQTGFAFSVEVLELFYMFERLCGVTQEKTAT
jgi:hypothetical protein